MADIVQVKCPHCNQSLRIPAAWTTQALRCKFCKKVFEGKATLKSATPADAKKAAAKASPAAANNPFAFEESSPAPPAVKATAKATVSPKNPPRPADGAKEKPAVTLTPSSGIGKRLALIAGGIAILLIFGTVAIAGLYFVGSALLKKMADQEVADGSLPQTSARKDLSPENKDPSGADIPEKNGGTDRPIEAKSDEVKPNLALKDKVPEVIGKRNKDVAYPRRALLISVNDYVIPHPLTYGRPAQGDFKGSSTAVIAELLHANLDFPRNQIAELSDKSARPVAPVKATIEKTVSEFLANSRAQDHVLLLFAGHATELNDEAFLVPIDGKLDDPRRLVGFKWLYGELNRCKARQKILVLDVCRSDSSKGPAQPGSATMGAVLQQTLKSPPPGVEVWASCSAKQQSWESDGGSVFLEMICKNCTDLPTGPENSIPIKKLATRVQIDLDERLLSYGHKQTPALFGTGSGEPPAFNPKEAAAPAVAIREPVQVKEKLAANPILKQILDDISLVPPTRGAKLIALNPAGFSEVPAKALEPFKSDFASIMEFKDKDKEFPLRAGLTRAIQALQENARGTLMRTTLDLKKDKELQVLKTQVNNEQNAIAKRTFLLKESVRDLIDLGEKHREGEIKRVQVLFDFVMLRLKARVVYVEEYNFNLAAIRSDSLPSLGDGENAYRLTAQEKVTINEGLIKEYVKELKRGWQNMAKNYPDTPWAIVAAQEQQILLGLSWKGTKK